MTDDPPTARLLPPEPPAPRTYEAAEIEATVKVTAHSKGETHGDAMTYTTKGAIRRTVELTFRERFTDDVELDRALDAFTATVRAAARRPA